MAFKGGIHGTIDIRAKAEGKQEILLNLLGIKYGEVPQRFVELVKSASSEKLDTWATHLLLVNSLEETFV